MRKGLLLTSVFLIGLGLLLVLSSCARKEADTPPETAVTTTPAPPQPTTPPSETPPSEEAPATADLFAGSCDALAGLESYRYSVLVMNEEEVAGTQSFSLEGRVQGGDNHHLVWTALETQETFEVIRIGDKAWVKDAEEGEWEEIPQLVADGLTESIFVFAPLPSWNNLRPMLSATAEYVDQETIAGVASSHYSCDFTGWIEGAFEEGISESSSDVWIAEDGFPVKYAFTATGPDAEGNQGSVEWTMELKDVNQPISIEPPM